MSTSGRRSLPGGSRQLAAHTERAAHEETFDLLAAVHQTQSALREPGDRARAVREKSIECTDGRAHESNLALAPALVAAQNAQRAGVLALAASLENQLRQ